MKYINNVISILLIYARGNDLLYLQQLIYSNPSDQLTAQTTTHTRHKGEPIKPPQYPLYLSIKAFLLQHISGH